MCKSDQHLHQLTPSSPRGPLGGGTPFKAAYGFNSQWRGNKYNCLFALTFFFFFAFAVCVFQEYGHVKIFFPKLDEGYRVGAVTAHCLSSDKLNKEQ